MKSSSFPCITKRTFGAFVTRCDLIRLADEHDIGNAPTTG
jgi:hypothetical protein